MKKVVVDVLEKALKELKVEITREEIEKLIEIPPSLEFGDYAFPCFFLADKLKTSPHYAALELRKVIQTPSFTDFDDIQTQGPYLNFFIDRKNLARQVVWEIINQKKNYGRVNLGKRKKVIVEMSSPNIAKPFGIGHLRSTIIGNSLSKIHEFLGYKTITMNYLGDWGAQFGRILFGYTKFGREDFLLKNPIHHLLNVYVKASKKRYDKDAKEWFKKLEEKDKKALLLWKLFKTLGTKDFEKIYKLMGIKFNVYSSESESIKYTKKVLAEMQLKGLVKKSQGALIVDLKKYGLDVSILIKSDGTTTYALRDLTAAIRRYKKYKFSSMIYEVGQEQTLYFKQLFKMLELMGYEWSKNCIHVSHGLYLDQRGKRMATRKGKIIFMNDIIDETISLAKKEISKRSKVSKEELERRAKKVATAAIFYGDLKNNRNNNMIFDIKKFVSFEGDTGPYLLYSYARATSILTKAGSDEKFKVYDLENKELELVQKLSIFQDVVIKSYKTLNPSIIANYSYQLSKIFNEFYHTCPVIGSQQEEFRLALVEAFRVVLKHSLNLLGIETLEEM